MLAPAFVCSHNQQRKAIPGLRRPPFSLCSAGLHACHSAATSLLLGGTYSPPRRAPVTQAGGSRQALPLGGCLAWKERRSDSPATKIRPFRCLEKRLTAPPSSPDTHTHTPTHPPQPYPPPASHQVHGTRKVKKSSRPECKRAATACQRRSAGRARGGWEEEVVGAGGWGRGWGQGEAVVLNDGT